MQRHYDNWLEAYLKYTANTEAPEHFHFWVGVSTLASAVGRSLIIDQGHFQWVPNFFIAMVAKAGLATKSTAIGIGEDLLRATGKVKFAANSSTWQALVEELTESRQLPIDNLDGAAHCTLTIIASELGTFLDLENREQVEFLTETWDAKRSAWVRRTVGGGDYKKKIIENPCLNMIAATTPNWIKNNYKQNMVGGGFSSRLIMVQAKHKQRYIAYPSREEISDERKQMRQKLVDDLCIINDLYGEMQLTEDAMEWGSEWYRDHHEKLDLRQLRGEQFDGYYARKQTHMHKLAMIMSVSTGNSLTITKEHLIGAHESLMTMEKSLGELMDYAQASGYYAMAKLTIMNTIRERGSIDRDQLYSEVNTVLSGRDFDRIMGDLSKAHLITLMIQNQKVMVSPKVKPTLTVVGGKK